jgi:PGF-CTERM protein
MTRDASFRAVLAALVVCSAVGVGAAPAAAQSDGPTPTFAVDLAADGSAEVTLTLVYNLSTDAERAAFDELQTNETAQAETRTRFRNRMQAVAEDAGNDTGREMRIEDAAIELQETSDGDLGVVNLSVTYVGLAAVEDGTLTVTEPFASGFEPDRRFVVTAPDGYAVASATPSADTSGDARLVYDAGTDLSGFELVVEETATPMETDTEDGADGDDTEETPGGTTDSGGQPGFGVVTAALAMGAAALVALRRQ